MKKKDSVRILVGALIVGLVLYFFLRRVWRVEGFAWFSSSDSSGSSSESSSPMTSSTTDETVINRSTMTSKYGEYGKMVPKSDDYMKPNGILFPPTETQQACTPYGTAWGIPFATKSPDGIYAIRLYTPYVCKYILGGTYKDMDTATKKMYSDVTKGRGLPDGYGYCIKDIQLGANFNNILIKDAYLNGFDACGYLSYTNPAF